MSLWNKILLGFVFIASLAFLHAAARTVKTYRYWNDKVKRFDVAIDKAKDMNRLLVVADNQTYSLPNKDLGIRKLRADLDRIVSLRGRIWDACERQKVQANTGAPVVVTLSTANAVPNGPGAFTSNLVVYAFEANDDGGNYYGEFHVTAVSDATIELTSNSLLSTREIEQISKTSTNPWILYEIMPIDRHETFADVDKDRINHLLPEGVRDEYLYDGKEGDPKNHPEQTGHIDPVTNIYHRPLRDYREIFHNCYRDRTLFNDTLQSVSMDLTFIKNCVADVLKQKEFAEKEIAELKASSATATKEAEAVKAHLARLNVMVGGSKVAIDDAIAKNKMNAALIAKLQREAAEQIDRRMRSMVQTSMNENGAGTATVPRAN
jgi:hypothetical protein